MSDQFPQAVRLVIKEAEGLPLFAKAYVSVEVRQRKSHPTCPVPTTAVTHNKARAVWDETLKILLLPGSNVDVVFTVWSKTDFNCDAVLGRGTLTFPRMQPGVDITVALGGRRILRVAVDVVTVPVIAARASSNGRERKASHDSVGDGWCHDEDVVFSEQNVHRLLSRSAVNWLASRLEAAKRRAENLQATTDEAVAAAEDAREKLESLKRAVALGREIDVIKEEERKAKFQQCTDEMRAALQALEGAEQERDRERKLRIISEREANQMRATASKFKELMEEARAKSAEAAAVEALVAGGSHKIIEDLEEKISRLSYENKLLRVRTAQYDDMVELVNSLSTENDSLKDYHRRKARRIAQSIRNGSGGGTAAPIVAQAPAPPAPNGNGVGGTPRGSAATTAGSTSNGVPSQAPCCHCAAAAAHKGSGGSSSAGGSAKYRPLPVPTHHMQRDNAHVTNFIAEVRSDLDVHTLTAGKHPLPPAAAGKAKKPTRSFGTW